MTLDTYKGYPILLCTCFPSYHTNQLLFSFRVRFSTIKEECTFVWLLVKYSLSPGKKESPIVRNDLEGCKGGPLSCGRGELTVEGFTLDIMLRRCDIAFVCVHFGMDVQDRSKVMDLVKEPYNTVMVMTY